MRDALADEEYFNEYIKKENNRIANFNEEINEGKIRPERVKPVKEYANYLKLCVLIAKYSSGYSIEEIKKDFLDIIKSECEGWNIGTGYSYILSEVSLGILLNISNDHFSLMERKVLEIGMEDALLKFLFDYKLEGKVTDMEGEVKYKKPYITLQEIATNQNERLELLTRYIKKEWYKGHSSAGWYNTHKELEKKLYNGYWSFEAGAIAKILNIDDSSLKDTKYYPYDLVHFTE